MNDQQIKDKAVFVVALLAIFLALSPFKEELSVIYLVANGHNYSLWIFATFLIFSLVLSVYSYALYYLKYSLGKYQNFFIFKIFGFLGDFFYFIAITYPLLIILIIILNTEPLSGFVRQYRSALIVFDIIAGLVAIALGIAYALNSIKESRSEEVESIEKTRGSYLQKAFQLFEKGFYGESVMESFKTLEFILREKLLENRGLSTRYMPVTSLLNFAIEKGVINKRFESAIKDVQGLRNKFAHSLAPLKKEDAQFALDTVKKLLEESSAYEAKKR